MLFAKNPWPKGHRIVSFAWIGRVETDSVWFDLDLQTAEYSEGDRSSDDDDDEHEDWRAKGVWNNYHRCSLSSVKWPGEATGVLAGTSKKPLDFAALSNKPLRADKVPVKGDAKPAFRIYLLGHDAVADHTISFTKKRGSLALEWRGRICLAYAGRTKYQYSFAAVVPGVTFGGFVAGEGVEHAAAREALTKCVVGGAALSLKRPRAPRMKIT